MANEERSSNIAYQILFATFRFLLPGYSERITAVSDVVDAISDARLGYWDRKELHRLVSASADKLARRLESFEQSEFTGLQEHEREAASLAVCAAVESLQLTKNDVIDNDSNVSRLYALLLPAATREWRQELISTDGQEYGKIFLREVSQFLVTIVRDLPEFTQEVAIRNLALARQIFARLNSSIDSVVLPQYRSGTQREFDTYEAAYRSGIVHYNKDMELFGLSLPPELRRQPLDIAYISLNAFSDSGAAAPLSRNATDKSGRRLGPQRRVDAILGSIATKNSESMRNLPLDRRRGVRVLITGQAGLGKTTLTQWIAVRAAEHNFPSPLTEWNSRLPVLHKLRELFPVDSPLDPTERHLFSLGIARFDMPGDWPRKTLQEREMLLILDGLDELGEFQRSRMETWLESFMCHYPHVDIIVSSRPEAVNRLWFHLQQFTRLDLQPMDLDDIRRCIGSWFSAVSSIAPEQEDDLNADRNILIGDVEQRTSVRELAEVPLVCAMLCAFYAYSLSASAPESKGQLYQNVIDTLVDARDRARRVTNQDYRRFTLNERLSLLQALARYLTENDRSEIPLYQAPPGERSDSALTIVDREMRSLAAISLSPREALDFLVKRSIIFREIAPGIAHFAHRSLQEFLTARSFAKVGPALRLLDYLGSDQWDRIVSFAATHLDRKTGTAIISAILDRSLESESSRRRLLLLAADCLSGISVDPPIAERAVEMIRAVLPPTNLAEAEVIGRSSEGVVRWLVGYEDESDEIVAACIRAAAVNKGPVGLNVIASYRYHAMAPKAVEEVLNGWQYFDQIEYAREILSHVSFGDSVVRLTNSATLTAAGLLANARKIKIDTYTGKVNFGNWSGLGELRELDCSGYRRLGSLRGVSVLKELRSLSLIGCDKITDFTEIRDLPKLENLFLDRCHGLVDPVFVSGSPVVRVLSLNECVSLTGFDWLENLPGLWTLSVNGCRAESVSFCQALPNLRTLRAATRNGVNDISSLRDNPELHTLELKLKGGRKAPIDLSGFNRLRSIRLSGAVTVEDIEAVAKCMGLTELTAYRVEGLHDLAPLSELRDIRRLRLVDCRDLTTTRGLGNFPSLTLLDLSGSAIRYLNVPDTCSLLSEVNLERCSELNSVIELVAIPGIHKLILPPIDETVLEELKERAFAIGNDDLIILSDPIPTLVDTG